MIPTYDQIMFPLLNLISDKNTWDIHDVYERLAEYFKNDPRFKMTEEERNQMQPSGQQRVFENRVGWARTYLKKALLLDAPERGKIRITERGLELLAKGIDKIDKSLLARYPEFREFYVIDRFKKVSSEEIQNDTFQLSPDEQLQSAYEMLKDRLVDEIQQKLRNIAPRAFERLIIDVLLKMGYGANIDEAGKVLGQSGDGGIDGVIKQDTLGLDNIYLQAKRWNEAAIGRPKIQEFVGALQGKGATKGVFITTSKFSQDAMNYAKSLSNLKVILIDGEELAQLMIRYNVGVTTIRTVEIKRIDNDYFDEYEEF